MKQVLNLIEHGELCDSVDDWYSFLGFCDFHRITGYLADSLNAISDIPVQVKRHARIQKDYQVCKQSKLVAAANELSARLECMKLSHSFLKGVVLTGEIYDFGQRCSNDVDLLIAPKDLSKTSNILKSLGYVQGLYRDGSIKVFDRAEIIRRRMNWGEVAPFVKLVEDDIAHFVEIDINFSLDWMPKNASLTEKFLQNTTVSNNGIRALDAEHCLVFLCVHLYKEAYILSMVKHFKDIEVYKYIDIFKIVNLIDKERFWRLSDMYGLKLQCEYALYCTNILFPSLDLKIKKPKNLDKVIDPESRNKEHKWDISFIERLYNTSRLDYLRMIE